MCFLLYYRIVACFFFFFFNVEMLSHFLKFEVSTMLIVISRKRSIDRFEWFLSRYDRNNSSSFIVISWIIDIEYREKKHYVLHELHVRVHYRSKKNSRVIISDKGSFILISINHPFYTFIVTLQFHVIQWNLSFYVP